MRHRATEEHGARHRSLKLPCAFSVILYVSVAHLFAPAAAPASTSSPSQKRERVAISKDGTGFVLTPSRQAFTVWGFNYDRTDAGGLLEDWWDAHWRDLEGDFGEMRQLGGNVARVHLQFGKFM